MKSMESAKKQNAISLALSMLFIIILARGGLGRWRFR